MIRTYLRRCLDGWRLRPRRDWLVWRRQRDQVPVCAQVSLVSLQADGIEQLIRGPVPGALFSEVSYPPRLTARVSAHGEVRVTVQNLSKDRLPFQGCFEMDSDVLPGRRELLPIPAMVLPPSKQATVSLRVIHGGVLRGLMIPTLLAKPKKEKLSA